MKREKWRNYLKGAGPHKAEWIVLILAALILNLFYYYTDLADATVCGLKFWTVLTEGRLPMFYHEGYIGPEGTIVEFQMGGNYDFAIYFIFALYNFPLWLWEKLTGFSFIQFVLTRIYSKGIIWLFSGISAYLLYKVARVCDVEEKVARWCPFLFLSSAVFFYTEVVINGIDIISVAFTLLGLYAYLKGDNKGFVASFAVAIAMKMFALWLFIPLVLLKEKRIWRILLYGIEGISVIAVPKIYFAAASHRYMIDRAVEQAGAAANEAEIAQNTGYAVNEVIAAAEGILNEALFPRDRIAEYTFVSMKELPLVFVGMFAIWIFCYLYKKTMTKEQIVYLCAFTMGLFVLTVKLHPYWGIVAVPYLILLLVLHPWQLKDNLILEGVFALGFVLNKAVAYYWSCNLNVIELMTMPQHHFSYASPEASGTDYGFSYFVDRLADRIGISTLNISYIFKAAAVVGLVMFLVWNWPGRKEDTKPEKNDFAAWRRWIALRFAVSCLVGMLPMVGLIVYLK